VTEARGDPLIEALEQEVDQTLLRENLRRSVDERIQRHMAALRFARALREAGRKARASAAAR